MTLYSRINLHSVVSLSCIVGFFNVLYFFIAYNVNGLKGVIDMLNDVLLLLIIYSFLGWIVECLYCALISGEWVNRGFLYGPFIPIYGFGIIMVLWALNYLPNNPFIIFIGSIIITSILEYFTSLILELIFKTKWWDYSDMPFNLHGRICLLNSILFGIGFMVVYYFINPHIQNIINTFNYDYKLGFLSAFLIYFICDFILSTKKALNFVFKLDFLRNARLHFLNKYKYLEDILHLS